jgi:O-antigen/teichoic acid export membrane protein
MISAGMMFGFVLLFLQNQKMLLTRIDKQFIIHALKFGIPLIPHAIGGLLIALSDRLIISNILNFKATGIYTVAFQMASVLGVLMSGLNTAYVPWLFEKLKIKSDLINRQIVTFTYLIFILILLFVFIGSYVF